MAASGAALNYPYRPIHKQQQSPQPSPPPPLRRGNHAMPRASSYESIVQKQPPRPPVTQPFHALTREEMGWESLNQPDALRPNVLKTKAPKPSFKLNKTQKRECGWNTSFPAEYGLVSLASDFKTTLSYTQLKQKELQQQKQLLRASASQVADADVWRNHHDSTLHHLQHTFNCHQPQPVSDPQDEIRIIKAILIREGLVTRLKGTTQKLRIGDHSSLHHGPEGSSVLTLLLLTREASLAVIEAIVRWYQTLAVPRPYIWNGRSYVHRMLDDLNFLGHVDVMAEALGVAPRSMVRNPFMMPTSIADRDLESFRCMVHPPPVALPSTTLPAIPATDSANHATPKQPAPAIAVADADAFLIWCCIHLEDVPAVKAPGPSNQTTAAQTTAPSTHQHVLEWQQRAEMQLKLLSMPMESSTGVHVMDSSPLMKRKGHLPALSAAPPETLHELIHHVHGPANCESSKRAGSYIWPPRPQRVPRRDALFVSHGGDANPITTGSRLPIAVTTNAKYANVKPRVSAVPKPHQVKTPPKPATKPAKRLPVKRNAHGQQQPTILTVQSMSVSHVELEALSAIETPPQVVALIAATVLILLTPGDLVPKDVSWNTSRTILSNGREFLRTLHAMSTGPPVADFKLRALTPFLANDKFRPQYLAPISKPAAVLCAWVLGMVHPDSTRCTLHDPAMADERDRSDLAASLDEDTLAPSSSAAPARIEPEVLVVHASTDGIDERILYSGTWTYRGLKYFVTFFLAAPTTLRLKLFEPQSAIETQATMTAGEIHQLFGDTATQYVQGPSLATRTTTDVPVASAWIELCQLILNQLDHVMAPHEMDGTRCADDEAELWDALSTPRDASPLRPTPEDVHGAAVTIQCATRQKQSRERVRRMRASRKAPPYRQKAPTLFMTGAQLHKLETQPSMTQKPSPPLPSPKTRTHSLQHHRSLVDMQANYGVDVEPEWKEIEAHAVHGIKSASRRRLSNVQVHDLEKLLHSTASASNLKHVAHPKQQHDDAALHIQCAVRQRLARRKVHHTRLATQQNAAAVRIQCAARQRFARDNVRRLQSEPSNQAVTISQDGAADHISCMARPRKASHVVQHRQDDMQQLHEEPWPQALKPDDAAVRIQCMARKRRAQKTVRERRQRRRRPHQRHTQPEAAAVRIQCMARRYTATKVVQARRETQSQRIMSIQQHNAALHIQCMTRQTLARKKVNLRRVQANGGANEYVEAMEAVVDDMLGPSSGRSATTVQEEPASPRFVQRQVARDARAAASSFEPAMEAHTTSQDMGNVRTRASSNEEVPSTHAAPMAPLTEVVGILPLNDPKPAVHGEPHVFSGAFQPSLDEQTSASFPRGARDKPSNGLAAPAIGEVDNMPTDIRHDSKDAASTSEVTPPSIEFPAPNDLEPSTATSAHVRLVGAVHEVDDANVWILDGAPSPLLRAEAVTSKPDTEFGREINGIGADDIATTPAIEAPTGSICAIDPTSTKAKVVDGALTAIPERAAPDPSATGVPTTVLSKSTDITFDMASIVDVHAARNDLRCLDISIASKSDPEELSPLQAQRAAPMQASLEPIHHEAAALDDGQCVNSRSHRSDEPMAENIGGAGRAQDRPVEPTTVPPLHGVEAIVFPVRVGSIVHASPSTDESPITPPDPTYANEFDDGFVLNSGRSSEPDPTVHVPVVPTPDAAVALQHQFNASRPETSAMYLEDEFEDE
ncbi:hypothetical protein, variant [Aphanomyces invadans]|uniref:Dynein heavy chain coiled coil stalk domain-containing protein n=1 Tax=Aphanomyces invadans TaxID=157072 RepID=A0A024TB45_9STRA|nr:hypothetical protein, variant [Aphanomyces invadans]ETV91355.1 hypothetical protein, variant [Aphanomyces invadans]|eukprot:XP_008879983.1 hypothetical protein, variant [Aphanomyces invadans]